MKQRSRGKLNSSFVTRHLSDRGFMAAYLYKASSMDGKMVEGTIEANDGGAVSIKLQDMGLLPIQVDLASGKTGLRREIEWPWKKRVRRKDILIFTQELHTL